MRSKQIKSDYYIFNIAALIVVIAVGLILFFSLFKSFRYRWYTVEGAFADITSITAEVEPKAYSKKDSLAMVTVQNNSDTNYEYRSDYTHVEQLKDGQWMYWAEIPFEKRPYTFLYCDHVLPAGTTRSYEIDLKDWLPVPFESGEYRIWMAYAEDKPWLDLSRPVGQVCAYFSI